MGFLLAYRVVPPMEGKKEKFDFSRLFSLKLRHCFYCDRLDASAGLGVVSSADSPPSVHRAVFPLASFLKENISHTLRF